MLIIYHLLGLWICWVFGVYCEVLFRCGSLEVEDSF